MSLSKHIQIMIILKNETKYTIDYIIILFMKKILHYSCNEEKKLILRKNLKKELFIQLKMY